MLRRPVEIATGQQPLGFVNSTAGFGQQWAFALFKAMVWTPPHLTGIDVPD